MPSIRKGFLVGCIIVWIATAFAEHDTERSAAITAAEEWLSLVDNGKYIDSWNQSAALFQNAIKAKKWKRTLLAIRKPIGKIVTREMISATPTNELPGAPDGDYVVIKYKSRFKLKKSAVETITPMLEKNGVWRVAGYYIR